VTRRVRSDAQRNLDALLDAAKAVFAASGVDAPVREIAARAGVGVGTFYRHFPQRSDLVKAVFQHEVDAAAEAAPALAAQHPPGEALERWLWRFTEFLAAKRGLAAALHSGDPAFEKLPDYFDAHLVPAITGLLDAAVAAGAVRPDVEPGDLITAVTSLSHATGGKEKSRRMITLLLDGLRHGASAPPS
jgi:AcrR family transcriptional regulator